MLNLGVNIFFLQFSQFEDGSRLTRTCRTRWHYKKSWQKNVHKFHWLVDGGGVLLQLLQVSLQQGVKKYFFLKFKNPRCLRLN